MTSRHSINCPHVITFLGDTLRVDTHWLVSGMSSTHRFLTAHGFRRDATDMFVWWLEDDNANMGRVVMEFLGRFPGSTLVLPDVVGALARSDR